MPKLWLKRQKCQKAHRHGKTRAGTAGARVHGPVAAGRATGAQAPRALARATGSLALALARATGAALARATGVALARATLAALARAIGALPRAATPVMLATTSREVPRKAARAIGGRARAKIGMAPARAAGAVATVARATTGGVPVAVAKAVAVAVTRGAATRWSTPWLGRCWRNGASDLGLARASRKAQARAGKRSTTEATPSSWSTSAACGKPRTGRR
mmetsp:Transcript_33312/g.88538  ORF Transcript_33312/g.88538 Transcript_33312/m.88538 type:complete len:220 (+) Transcript_33312:268-927(+)